MQLLYVNLGGKPVTGQVVSQGVGIGLTAKTIETSHSNLNNSKTIDL